MMRLNNGYFTNNFVVENQITEDEKSKGNEKYTEVYFFVFPWYPFTYIINLFSDIMVAEEAEMMLWKLTLLLEVTKTIKIV